jgi:hypothetical protein
MPKSLEADRALITALGGPSKVAELLGYPKEGGVQRVQNWKRRGIPSAVKLERPDLFAKRSGGKGPSKAKSQAIGAHGF